MNRKVKYTWTLTYKRTNYGDKSLVLSDKCDIDFFDYLNSLTFVANEFSLEDFDFDEREKLIELFRKTKWCSSLDKNKNVDNEIIDALEEIEYLSFPFNERYADIKDFTRKEINDESVVNGSIVNKKLNDKYIKEMDKCFELDEENGHIEADGVLCDLLMTLGYEDVVNKFYELDKWYS